MTLTLREAFNLHYPTDELSKGYIVSIKAALSKWEAFTGNPPITEVDNELVARFRAAFLESGASPRTVNGYWASLRSVFRRCGPPETGNPFGLGLLARTPAMRACRVQHKLPRRLTEDELNRAYLAAKWMRSPRTACANAVDWWRAMIVTGYTTGLRVGDLLRIRWEHVNTEAGTLWVRTSKTQIEAELPLHPVTVDHLNRLERADRPIFYVEANYLYTLWNRLLSHAGVKFGFHDIRRTSSSAVEAVRPGMGRTILLHAPASVTDRSYLNSMRELAEAIQAMHIPLAFRHGINLTERAIRDSHRAATIHARDVVHPLKPPREAFHFDAGGFRLGGQWYPLSPLLLAILRILVEATGPVPHAELVERSGSKSKATGNAKESLRNLRKRLRALLGLPAHFNPVPTTTAARFGNPAGVSLALPPALWTEPTRRDTGHPPAA